MSILGEFREFIARGNVVDLAVGVVIGGAFGKIVTSLVGDLIMPPIGLLLGGVDFTSLKIVIKAADPARKAAEVAIRYGVFLNTVLQFLIVAVAVFMMVKLINAIRRAAGDKIAEAAGPSATERLLSEIRDLLARPTPRV